MRKVGAWVAVTMLGTLVGACAVESADDPSLSGSDAVQCAPTAGGGGACQQACRSAGGALFWDKAANGGKGAWDCVYGTDACWATPAEGASVRQKPWATAARVSAASPCTDLLLRAQTSGAVSVPSVADDFGDAPVGTTIAQVMKPGGECEQWDYLEQSGSSPATKRCWRKVVRVPMAGGQYATDRRLWTAGWVRSDLLTCGATKALGSAAAAADPVCRANAIAALPDQTASCSAMTFASPKAVAKGGVASTFEEDDRGFKVRGRVTDGRRYRFSASWFVGTQTFHFGKTVDSSGDYCFFGEGASGYEGFIVSAQEIDAKGAPVGSAKYVAP